MFRETAGKSESWASSSRLERSLAKSSGASENSEEGEEKGGSESRVMTSMGEGEGDSNEGEGEGESSKIRVDGVAGRDIGSDEIGVGDPEEGQKKARTEGVQQEEKGWSGEKTGE